MNTAKHKPTGLMNRWCKFGDGGERAYILMAIARRKHNEDLTHNSEVVFRRVLRSKADVEEQYNELQSLIDGYPYTFRIYLTVNARNVLDTYFHFQSDLNEWSQDYIRGDTSAIAKMGKVGSRWKSALHNPSVKDDSYFLYDLDDVTESDVEAFVGALKDETPIQMVQETPNGYHVVTDPFNYTMWETPIDYDDRDTDGMVFVDEVEGHS